MSLKKNTNCSPLLILLKLQLLLILYSVDVAASSTCQRECGKIEIPFPFGIGNDCYLDKYYEVECRSTNTSRKVAPFLPAIGKEVVSITLPNEEHYFSSVSYGFVSSEAYGLVRVKNPITSTGCFSDGRKYTEPVMNLTGSPFFSDGLNSLIAAGCNAKVSLTHIKPSMMGCELNCNARRDSHLNSIPFFNKTGCSTHVFYYDNSEACEDNKPGDTECDGNGCCKANLGAEPRQVIGIRIESNSTTREDCRVAFLTDEVYTLSNATKPEELFAKGYATLSLGWIIQTKNSSFLNSLACTMGKDNDHTIYSAETEPTCRCGKSTMSEISHANCECKKGYLGNPYDPKGCKDIDECKRTPKVCGKGEKCENTIGGYQCVADKTKAILIGTVTELSSNLMSILVRFSGVGAGVGVLVLVSGVWGLRKFLIKRRMTKRKKKFFKRNGGLLLQQELNTRQGNVEKTRIFSSRELGKATENFSENRVLGHGGQGTVYKGMLLDGRTVAVKKPKVIDEDKLQEFINEVVILSQINHRHVVKLLGCCLETEVPMLVYEFIINGNLYQHLHEDSDDYTIR